MHPRVAEPATHGPAANRAVRPDRRRTIVTLRPERIAEWERPYERFAERAGRLTDGYSVEEVMLLVRHYDRMQAVYLAELDRLRNDDTAQRSA